MNQPAAVATRVIRINAAAIADGAGFRAAPASLLLELAPGPGTGRPRPILLAAGHPADVDRHPAAHDVTTLIERPNHLLLPGLVNAHTHLDLTHIGPLPYDAAHPDGFVAWVDTVRTRRALTPDAIAASVRAGIALSRRAGTVAVGDIGGAAGGRPNLTPWRTLRDSPLTGVSFLEFFGIGLGSDARLATVAAAIAEARAEPPVPGGARLGLQPHAPNTVSTSGYTWAARQGLPLSTHLAETFEERLFIGEARGPQRALLERFGFWTDALLAEVGLGRHPVEHLRSFLESAPGTIAAHVNDSDDAAIETLARTGAVVAYCPRASMYFGAEQRFGPHRYREMLGAGVPVALGTDSIINLPPSVLGVRGRGMSVLDEARVLARRDGTDPGVLLAMATVNGAAALGLDRRGFGFGPDSVRLALAGVLAVEVGSSLSSAEEALGMALRQAAEPGVEVLSESFLPE